MAAEKSTIVIEGSHFRENVGIYVSVIIKVPRTLPVKEPLVLIPCARFCSA